MRSNCTGKRWLVFLLVCILTGYRNEALRRNLEFKIDVLESPRIVVGDAKKIKTVVANLTANAGMIQFPISYEGIAP